MIKNTNISLRYLKKKSAQQKSIICPNFLHQSARCSLIDKTFLQYTQNSCSALINQSQVAPGSMIGIENNHVPCRYLGRNWLDFLAQTQTYLRNDSMFTPSQWETSLQSNDVSHWLGANLESALYLCGGLTYIVLITGLLFCLSELVGSQQWEEGGIYPRKTYTMTLKRSLVCFLPCL